MDYYFYHVVITTLTTVVGALVLYMIGYVGVRFKKFKKVTSEYEKDHNNMLKKIEELESEIEKLKDFNHLTKLGLDALFTFANHGVKNGKMDNAIKKMNNFRP